jgi:hypothetical protein
MGSANENVLIDKKVEGDRILDLRIDEGKILYYFC